MFVDRDQGGKIIASYFSQQRPGQEQVADSAPELLAFWQALANPVPGQVTAGQLIRALDQLGLLAAVDAAVASADALTQRLWARAPIFPRNDPLLLGIAQALGKSDADLDDIFRLASSL
jgi:hypothetical protein